MIRNFLKNAKTCRIHTGPGCYPRTTYTGEFDDESTFLRGPLYELKVPREMIEKAELKEEAIVVGMGYHFEIWSLSEWGKRKFRPPYQTISRGLFYPDIIA